MYGKKLFEIRKTLKLSQEEIASQTGISYRAYSSYERNERNPSLDFLKKIENNYNVNLNWLIADDGETFNKNFTTKTIKIDKNFSLAVEEILKQKGLI